MTKNKLALICALLFSTSSVFATNRIGRMGVGMSSQLKNDLQSISFKLQKSKSFALGFIGNYSSKSNGGYGLALKAYKNLFDEPQLNFYMSGLGGYLNKTSSAGSNTGFQVDLTLGSEFAFNGIESLGFSFETGFSIYDIGEFTFETVGHTFLVAGIHFYL